MHKYVLSIEDNESDIKLMTRIFERDISGVSIHHLKGGKEALEYIEKKEFLDNFPSLILLDIKMTGMSGLDVLELLKKNKKFEKVPIVIFSSSIQQSDLQRAYELSVNSYIEKPKDYQKLKETVKLLTTYWLELNKN